MTRATKEGASAVPGSGWEPKSDPGLFPPKLEADVSEAAVLPGRSSGAWLLAPRVSLGSSKVPVLLKCHPIEEEEKGFSFSGTWVGRTSHYKAVKVNSVSRGRSRAPLKAPARRCAQPLACASLSDWRLQEQWQVESLEAGPGSLGPRGPRGCWAVVVAKRNGRRGPGLAN